MTGKDMPTISHLQAQAMLQAAADDRLNAAERPALQAHLQDCPVCQAYAQELDSLQAELRATLHARWDAVPLASPATRPLRPTHRRIFPMQRLSFNLMGPLALAALILVLVSTLSWLRPQAGQLQATDIPAISAGLTPAPTATPVLPSTPPNGVSVPLGENGGRILFESLRDGNLEIYSMDATGNELVNLTQNPANDQVPVWSPDAQRIAFISDRSGQTEVYVMDPQGENVVQLTHSAPDEGWLVGPLEWSPDGSQILLVQQQKGPEVQLDDGSTTHDLINTYLYLVNTDGSGGKQLPQDPDMFSFQEEPDPDRTLSETLMYYNARWSPDGSRIAYTAVYLGREQWGFVEAQSGKLAQMTSDPTMTYNALAWSPDGTRLAFGEMGPWEQTGNGLSLAEQAGARLRISSLDGTEPPVVVEHPSPAGSLTHLTWSPDGQALSYILDPEGDGCWQVYFVSLAQSESEPLPASGLCFLIRGRQPVWSNDSQWLFLAAAQESAGAGSIWAIRVSELLQPGGGEVYFRLTSETTTDFSPNPQPGAWFTTAPVIPDPPDPNGPTATPLPVSSSVPDPSFNPPASAEGATTTPAPMLPPPTYDPNAPSPTPVFAIPTQGTLPPAAANGRLAFTSRESGKDEIYTSNPDGSGLLNLTNNPANDSAPAWSPDGLQIAFVSDRTGVKELYVMSAGGADVRQLSQNVFEANTDGGKLTNYVWIRWSPDGKRLLAWIMAGPESYLGITDVAAGQTHYISPGICKAPVWGADNNTIFCVQGFGLEAEIIAVDASQALNPLGGEYTTNLTQSPNWGENVPLAWTADGTGLVYFASFAQEQDLTYQLWRLSPATYDTYSLLSFEPLPFENGTDPYFPGAELAVCPVTGKIVFSLSGLPASDPKAGRIYTLNPDGSGLTEVAISPVPIYHLSCAPDGRYALFHATGFDPQQPEQTQAYTLDLSVGGLAEPIPLPNQPEEAYNPVWQPVPQP